MTVEGVGVLAFKNFTPDEAFEQRLNPQGARTREDTCPAPFRLGVVDRRCGDSGRPDLRGTGVPDALRGAGGRYDRSRRGGGRADMPAPVEAPDALAEVPQAELPTAEEEFPQSPGTASSEAPFPK